MLIVTNSVNKNLGSLLSHQATKVIKFMIDAKCSYVRACTHLEIPSPSKLLFVISQNESLKQKLNDAQIIYEDGLFNKVLEEAYAEPQRLNNGSIDGNDIAHKRVKIQALQWCLQTINPEKFGTAGRVSKPIPKTEDDKKKIEIIERIVIDAREGEQDAV